MSIHTGIANLLKIIDNNENGLDIPIKQKNGNFCAPVNSNNKPNDIEDFAGDFMT